MSDEQANTSDEPAPASDQQHGEDASSEDGGFVDQASPKQDSDSSQDVHDPEDVEQQAPQLLKTFLQNLGDDTQVVLQAVGDDSLTPAVRKPLAAGLNYLFQSLDLIDDGIEGLGLLDDAFVLRVCAERAQAAGTVPDEVASLAEGAGRVRELLGHLASRFDAFVVTLDEAVVRGRSVQAIVEDPTVREELVGDVSGWVARYAPPPFAFDQYGLVKVRSFLQAKLPV